MVHKAEETNRDQLLLRRQTCKFFVVSLTWYEFIPFENMAFLLIYNIMHCRAKIFGRASLQPRGRQKEARAWRSLVETNSPSEVNSMVIWLPLGSVGDTWDSKQVTACMTIWCGSFSSNSSFLVGGSSFGAAHSSDSTMTLLSVVFASWDVF